MGLVAADLEVLVVEGKQVALVGDGQGREGVGLPGQLLSGLVDVVQIEVGVAEGVNEFPGLQACDLDRKSVV